MLDFKSNGSDLHTKGLVRQDYWRIMGFECHQFRIQEDAIGCGQVCICEEAYEPCSAPSSVASTI